MAGLYVRIWCVSIRSLCLSTNPPPSSDFSDFSLNFSVSSSSGCAACRSLRLWLPRLSNALLSSHLGRVFPLTNMFFSTALHRSARPPFLISLLAYHPWVWTTVPFILLCLRSLLRIRHACVDRPFFVYFSLFHIIW